MKINLEYISELLSYFIESEKPFLELGDLVTNTGDGIFDDQFIFHYSLLVENGLLSRTDLTIGSLKNMGVISSDNGLGFISLDIRLTQSGHDFAKALNNKEVLERLKSEFKDAPFKVVFDGGRKLLEHAFKKKLNDLLGS